MLIEVTSRDRGKILVNTDYIVYVITIREGTCLYMANSYKPEIIIEESQEYIKKAIAFHQEPK